MSESSSASSSPGVPPAPPAGSDRLGRLSFVAPAGLSLYKHTLKLLGVHLEAYGPERSDTWEMRMARIDALVAQRSWEQDRRGERLEELTPGPEGLRLVLYRFSDIPSQLRWLALRTSGSQAQWMAIHTGPASAKSDKELILKVARAWIPPPQRPAGSFSLPQGSIALPLEGPEEVEVGWRTPNADEKRFSGEDFRLSLRQKFPPKSAPPLLERFTEFLSLTAKHAVGSVDILRRGEREAAGVTGQEVVIKSEDEGRLFCAWMFLGQKGPVSVPVIEGELSVENLKEQGSALRAWDGFLSSLKLAG